MRRISMLLMLLGMLVFAVGPVVAAAPEIDVTSPKDGAALEGGLVAVKYQVKNFKVVDFTKDQTINETQGHIHIQLDDNPLSTIHTSADTYLYAGVKPGQHTLKLWLVHSNHTPLKTPVETTVHFTMEAKKASAQ
jgi:uncharacterized protein DUF6130